MDLQVIEAGGLRVPLEDTPFGPRPVGSGDDPGLDALQWVLNGGLDGDLEGLVSALERREACNDGTVYARPVRPGDDLETARNVWRERTGGELGADVYALRVRWRDDDDFFIPRPVLLDLLQRLAALREASPKPPSPWLFALQAIHRDPHTEEEEALRVLERLAAEFDAFARASTDGATVAAKRRLLLAELEDYGLLTGSMGQHRLKWLDHWRLPTLSGYQRAAIALGVYASSEPRIRRIGPPPEAPSVVGFTISVDWFRFPRPVAEGWDRDEWLVFCEQSLRNARIGEGQEGELYVHAGEVRAVIAWRRDDGITPCVVSARLR